MTTTLHLSDDLARAVEEQAKRTGQTPNEVIESALQEVLLEKKTIAKPYELRWVIVKGESPPDVDIDDRDALYERMEGRS